MIKRTDEMTDAVDQVWVGGGNASQAVEAVLAIVERDHCLDRCGHVWQPLAKPGPVVHLATKGDAHMHCCGVEVLDLPSGDRWQFDPHGITCKGPTS